MDLRRWRSCRICRACRTPLTCLACRIVKDPISGWHTVRFALFEVFSDYLTKIDPFSIAGFTKRDRGV